MHKSVYKFVEETITTSIIKDKKVLEIGSYDVNGSVRPLIEALGPKSYIGMDLRQGPGVDIVADISSHACFDKLETGNDVIICCEALEHIEYWRSAIAHMTYLLKPEGHIILTTRSLGFPQHDFPNDYWRFSVEDMHKIFSRFFINEIKKDPQSPGVFVHAQKPCSLEAIDVYAMPKHAT